MLPAIIPTQCKHTVDIDITQFNMEIRATYCVMFNGLIARNEKVKSSVSKIVQLHFFAFDKVG